MMYFLTGDIPLPMKYEELLKNIREKHPGIDEKIINVEENGEEKFLGILSINSMFAPRELVVLKGVEKIKKLDKFIESLDTFDISQKEIVFVYKEELDDYDRPTNRPVKKIVDIVGKRAKIILCRKELEKKGLHFYVEKELKISEYDSQRFCELIGEDYDKLKNEISKVKSFFRGEEFNLEKVLPILSINKEGNLKILMEKFLYEKKVDGLLEFLNREKEYMRFLYMLNEEIILLLKIKLLEKREVIRSTMSYKQFKENIYEGIKKYFRRERGDYIKEYPIFLKFSNLDKFKEDFLEEKIEEILFLEGNIKGGMVPEEISLEKFIGSFFKKC